MLTVIAAAGAEVSLEVIERLAGPAFAAVQEAIAARILRRVPAAVPRYRLLNHGDRDALLSCLSAAERRDLKRRVRMLRRSVGETPAELVGEAPSDASPAPEAATVAPGNDARPHTAGGRAALCQAGDYWVLSDNGTAHHLRDSRGMQYIAFLLKHPDVAFHVLDLAIRFSVSGADTETEATSGGDTAATIAPSGRGQHDDRVLDARADAAYVRRLREVRDALDEADGFHDLGRAARLREEMEHLTEQLAAARGLGGRNRRASGNAERARCAVQKRIRESLRRISAVNPIIGRYLVRTIRTGFFCSYRPDPDQPLRWEV